MFYKLMPRKLDTQVAVMCAIVMLCTIPLYVIHEANEEIEFIFETAKTQTKVIAQNIAVNSIQHIVTRDYSSLEKLLINSAKFPSISDIQITNVSGKIISDVVSKEGVETEPRYSLNSIDVPSEEKIQVVNSDDDKSITVFSPIKSGIHIGWVRLDYSLNLAYQHQRERLLDYAIDGFILTLVISLLLMLAMRRPVKLIGDAVEFAARLDDKKGEKLPEIKHSIEIEKLFSALNKTSLSLTEQDAIINKGVKDLETQKHALDEHSIVTITDVNGKITYANDKLLSKTGYKLDELVGKNPSILNSGYHSKRFYKTLWDTISQGKTWHGEIADNDKQGSRIWMQTTIVPFLNEYDIPYEYVAIQSDITKHKETESMLEVNNTSLKVLTHKLDAKVKSRTTELEKANKKLSHLNNVKSEFVSIVSHELRTPLTAIKSFAEILEDDFDDIDVATRNKYLSIINAESVRLGNLINDVLDLQKIDAGKMTWNIETIDMKELASQTIELFNAAYKEKGLSLQLEMDADELFADVDSDKVKQVLSNLLSNAFKFTNDGLVTLGIKQIIQKATLLVISADEYVCKFLEALANELGMQSITYHNADDALIFIEEKKHKFDIVISELVMSEMNGAELISSIRSINRHVPIVVMNSDSDDNVLASLLNYNVSCVLTKPFDAADVTNNLTKIFESVINENIDVPMVEIFVEDNGLGIPRDALDKVFERFHQVESFDTREKGGSGLGLAICRDIVEYHRGRIWVTSEEGGGSRFSFNLPLTRVKTKRIGEILVESGVATQESIDKALANQ